MYFHERMGCTPCLADPDIWYKAEVRPDDGFEYYSYILFYVDDILVIHHDSLSILKRIDSYCKLKPTSIGDPHIYLGSKVTNMNLANGTLFWTLSPSKCVQEAVRKYDQALRDTYGGTHKLPKNAPNPFPMGYKPDMELTTHLGPELVSYYQSLIEVMRWMLEIGRIDIITEVSMMSSHNDYPREGNFEIVFHMIGYLKGQHNSCLAMDPNYPTVNEDNFKSQDCYQKYGEIK